MFRPFPRHRWHGHRAASLCRRIQRMEYFSFHDCANGPFDWMNDQLQLPTQNCAIWQCQQKPIAIAGKPIDRGVSYKAVTRSEEIALLRKYREHFAVVRKQLRALAEQRDALAQVINGLESMLRLQGIDPDQIDAVASDEESPETEDDSPKSALINAAVAALETVNVRMGTKALHALMLKRGVASNYYTLYKNLVREAAKPDGLITRFRDKFGLRKWASDDAP